MSRALAHTQAVLLATLVAAVVPRHAVAQRPTATPSSATAPARVPRFWLMLEGAVGMMVPEQSPTATLEGSLSREIQVGAAVRASSSVAVEARGLVLGDWVSGDCVSIAGGCKTPLELDGGSVGLEFLRRRGPAARVLTAGIGGYRTNGRFLGEGDDRTYVLGLHGSAEFPLFSADGAAPLFTTRVMFLPNVYHQRVWHVALGLGLRMWGPSEQH